MRLVKQLCAWQNVFAIEPSRQNLGTCPMMSCRWGTGHLYENARFDRDRFCLNPRNSPIWKPNETSKTIVCLAKCFCYRIIQTESWYMSHDELQVGHRPFV